MAQKPKESGHPSFSFLPGVTVPWKWAGMRREGARHEIPDNQFYLLQNVRIKGGQWESRGGQTKAVAAVLLGTAVTGIYDSEGSITSSAPRIFYIRQPTP